MRLALRALAPPGRCDYLHVGEMPRQRLSPHNNNISSEKIQTIKDWAAVSKASARRIFDSMCRRRE
jgi:hypothetical protein